MAGLITFLLLPAKNIKDNPKDYHQNMNFALFGTWFSSQLLLNLPANLSNETISYDLLQVMETLVSTQK